MIRELKRSHDTSSCEPLDLRSNGQGRNSCNFATKPSKNLIFTYTSKNVAVNLRSWIQRLAKSRIMVAPKHLYHRRQVSGVPLLARLFNRKFDQAIIFHEVPQLASWTGKPWLLKFQCDDFDGVHGDDFRKPMMSLRPG